MTDSIIEKIRKLIDKAQSSATIGEIKEADALMLKVQELLQTYNLHMSEIRTETKERLDLKEDRLNYSERWEAVLMHVIAENNFCETLKTKTELIIIGAPANITIVEYLFSFYSNKLLALSTFSYGSWIHEKFVLAGREFEVGTKVRKNWLSSYFLGAIHGISTKMEQQIKDAERNSNLKSLVLTNSGLIKEYIAFRFGKIGKGKGVSVKDSGGYDKGYKDGRNISVNAGVSGSNKGVLNGN